MKSFVLLLAIIGIVLIAVGYIKSNMQCPPPKIEYRYISKTFDDEQNVNKPILSVGGMYSMFENDDPWIVDQSFATSDIKYRY